MVSEINVWVWLSLVEYLNGVQGVGGSNPLTQTIKTQSYAAVFFIIPKYCVIHLFPFH